MVKIYNLIYLLAFSSFLMISCNYRENNLTRDEIETIEKEVLAEFAKFESSLSNGDLETISKYYSEDPRFFWVENGSIAYPSGEAARSSIKSFYPSLKSMEFNSLDKKVTPINDSNVMFYVEYEQVLVFSSDQKIDINGAMTILMKKENEEWKFIIGHSSGKNENQNQSE
ncbi:nuclear transport factor 2 family protein [uncultured Croceitalea sp.]|uniref:nuclear transport factor 2 family protein n=1 Tax=uncultured Croceitalea sp. TaxID=1798908 RepID=UPI0033063A8C